MIRRLWFCLLFYSEINKLKKVAVYTGSRANYSSSKTIIRAVCDSDHLQLINIIGGAGPLKRYGDLPTLMVSDGLPPPDYQFTSFISDEDSASMAKSCALGLLEVATVLENSKPDMLVVVGDRYDVMSAVIAGAYMNIPIVHTMGGEVTGTIDESIRHAITKFANVHLVANEDAAVRVRKLGEAPSSIYNVGCPRMDIVKEAVDSKLLTSEIFNRRYPGVGAVVDIDSPFILASFHPVTTAPSANRREVQRLLESLAVLKVPTILLWPNFDAGGGDVAKAIRTFREHVSPDWLSLHTNFSVEDYSQLLQRTVCLVGNSSSGIREAAFLGTPVINIGSRQDRRVRAENVTDISDAGDIRIISKISELMETGKKYPSSTLYGDGRTGPRIAKILEEISIETTQKTITY